MKIAVYAIAKNEEPFVDRFCASAADADGTFVLDTGSTDGTLEKLQQRGVSVEQRVFSPWRFDVARNAALDRVPDDFDAAVILDLDELLVPGWRPALEKHLAEGATRVQATYTWGFDDRGQPLLTYFMDRAHLRHGYQWRGAVHETIRPSNGLHERLVASKDFKIEHRPDGAKSRGQYLALLEVACREEPANDRNSHYYGRELYNYGRNEEAIVELKRHAAMLHAWDAERAASLAYIGKAYQRLGNFSEAERWLLRACAEYPTTRTNWLSLAQFYLDRRQWEEAYAMAQRALRITSREKTYLDWESTWTVLPHDIAGVAAWYLGRKDEARQHMEKALAHDPNNSRLKNNLQLFP